MTFEEFTQKVNVGHTYGFSKKDCNLQESVNYELAILKDTGKWKDIALLTDLIKLAKIDARNFEIAPISFCANSIVCSKLGLLDYYPYADGMDIARVNLKVLETGLHVYLHTDKEYFTNDMLSGILDTEVYSIDDSHGLVIRNNSTGVCIHLGANRTVGRAYRVLASIPEMMLIQQIPWDDGETFRKFCSLDWDGVTGKYTNTITMEAVRRLQPDSIFKLCLAMYFDSSGKYEQLCGNARGREITEDILDKLPLYYAAAVKAYRLCFLKQHYPIEFEAALRSERR